MRTMKVKVKTASYGLQAAPAFPDVTVDGSRLE